MGKRTLVLALCLLIQSALTIDVDKLDEPSKNKLISCLTVVNLMTKHQKPLFEELKDFMTTHSGGNSNKAEMLSSLFLLLCYGKITTDQSKMINQNPNAVNVSTEEIKSLSPVEYVYNAYKDQCFSKIKGLQEQLNNITVQLTPQEKAVFETNFNSFFQSLPRNTGLDGLKKSLLVILIALVGVSIGYKGMKYLSSNERQKKNQ